MINRFISSLSPRLLRPFLSSTNLYDYLATGLRFCETLLLEPKEFYYTVHHKRNEKAAAGFHILDTMYDTVKHMVSFAIYHKDHVLLEAIRTPLIYFYP